MARRQTRPSSNNGANLGFEQKLWRAADELCDLVANIVLGDKEHRSKGILGWVFDPCCGSHGSQGYRDRSCAIYGYRICYAGVPSSRQAA